MTCRELDYDEGGIRPCGCIQPNKKDTTSKMNKAIESAIRIVRNFAVRLSSLLSLIRLNMPAPRLNRISASSNKIMSLIIMVNKLVVMMPEDSILLDVGYVAI